MSQLEGLADRVDDERDLLERRVRGEREREVAVGGRLGVRQRADARRSGAYSVSACRTG